MDFELPEVDDDVVEETRRRFEARQAEKLRRVMEGVDDRIVAGATGADDTTENTATAAASAEMSLEEREDKWGFTYDELKSATKVVSILFSNPSLYLGDPYLAESRLYTMVTRDRRTKRENQEVLRQVLNEERNRKDKIKRQQDIATIRKTTMKKEREEALNHLLTNTNDVAAIGARSQQELIEDKKDAAGDVEKDTEVNPTTATERTTTNNSSAVATAEKAQATAPLLQKKEKTQEEEEKPAQSIAELDRSLYHKRCLAGLEIIEVLHNPKQLVPLIATAKPGLEDAPGGRADDDAVFNSLEGDAKAKAKKAANAAPATVVRIKHGNNNKKGKDRRWARSVAAEEEREEEEMRKTSLSPVDTQQWRCYLTALYHRFWPTRELTTQMVRSINFADTWPQLTPPHLQHLRNLEGGEGGAPAFLITVDDVHHSLCLTTSRMSFFLESVLEEGVHRIITGADDGAGVSGGDKESVLAQMNMTQLVNELKAHPAISKGNEEASITAIDTLISVLLKSTSATMDGDDEDMNTKEDSATTTAPKATVSPFNTLLKSFVVVSSSDDDNDDTCKGACSPSLASVCVPKDTNTGVEVLRSALVTGKLGGDDAAADDEDHPEETRKTTIGDLLSSLKKSLESASTLVVPTDTDNIDREKQQKKLVAIGQIADLSKEAIVAVEAVLDQGSPSSVAALRPDEIIASSRRLFFSLLHILAKVVASHWEQYNALFEAVFGNKNMAGNAAKNFHFDPEATENDTAGNPAAGGRGKSSHDEELDGHHNTTANNDLFINDPFASHPLLARANFNTLAYTVTALYSTFLYHRVRLPSLSSSATATAEEEKEAKQKTAEVKPDDVLEGSSELFNGVKLAWLGLPPEAEIDGTIFNEEGLFERSTTSRSGGTKENNEDSSPLAVEVGLPYQDAMLFAAPSSSPSDTAVTSTGHAPSGCIVALRKETSHQLLMNRIQKCHTCKGRYKLLHPFYYSMCRPCSDYNYNKRLITRDLRGKVVLLTGARIKIGYAMAISLLRCGATVIGTTRFAMDAMGRFSAEPDFEEWKHRLHLYSVDLRDLWLVTQFCNFLSRKFPKMFAIINNAAQTIARTPAYTADLRRLEANPPESLKKTFSHDSSAVEWRRFFLENTSVTVGQSLHLDYHPTQNPIVEGEFNENNTALRSLDGSAFASLHAQHQLSAAAEQFLANETPEERTARLRRDGGDAITHATMNDEKLASHLTKRSDRYDTFAEDADKREKNSWTMTLAEVQGSEATEVMAINALSPFILNSRLKPLLMNRDGEDDAEEVALEERARLRREAIEKEDEERSGSKASASTDTVGGKKSNRALKREAVEQAEGASKLWNTKKASRFIINVSAMEGQFYRHKLTTHPHTNMAKAALNMMTRTSADDYAKDGIFMNSVDTGWITDESPATKKQRRADDNMLCPLDEVDAAARCLDLIYTDSREFGKFWKNYKVIPW